MTHSFASLRWLGSVGIVFSIAVLVILVRRRAFSAIQTTQYLINTPVNRVNAVAINLNTCVESYTRCLEIRLLSAALLVKHLINVIN